MPTCLMVHVAEDMCTCSSRSNLHCEDQHSVRETTYIHCQIQVVWQKLQDCNTGCNVYALQTGMGLFSPAAAPETGLLLHAFDQLGHTSRSAVTMKTVPSWSCLAYTMLLHSMPHCNRFTCSPPVSPVAALPLPCQPNASNHLGSGTQTVTGSWASTQSTRTANLTKAVQKV